MFQYHLTNGERGEVVVECDGNFVGFIVNLSHAGRWAVWTAEAVSENAIDAMLPCLIAMTGCIWFEQPLLYDDVPSAISFDVDSCPRYEADQKAETFCGRYGKQAEFIEIKLFGNRQIAYYRCK